MSEFSPRTPEEVFQNFKGRQAGINKALNDDVAMFFASCDPDRENLSLYSNADGSWVVSLPAEEVPPELPEPALGINFARDGMKRGDWLALVAVHSDAWLMAVAFYYSAKFSADQRKKLFDLINSLPTTYEVLSGKGGKKMKVATAANNNKRSAAVMQNNTINNDDAAGLKKPSPGVIMKQDAPLDSLVDAKIELYWPDDGLWYKAEVLSLNARARNAKVLYATGDVETLELDEIINEGHLNVCSK
ncbi:unnamed protein product [Bathycoccus prasinos]